MLLEDIDGEEGKAAAEKCSHSCEELSARLFYREMRQWKKVRFAFFILLSILSQTWALPKCAHCGIFSQTCALPIYARSGILLTESTVGVL